MEYVKIFEFTATICGYHYYKNFWKPKSHQVLNCYHEKNNAFARFPIMVCEIGKDGTIVGHLRMEISRVTKFLIDRGGSIIVELTSDHYRRSSLIQGAIEIPCKVTAKIPGTVITLLIMVKYIQLVQKLHTEPEDEDILGSFLEVETTGTDDAEKSRETYLNQKREKIGLNSKQKTIGIFLNAAVNKQRNICTNESTRIKHQKKKL